MKAELSPRQLRKLVALAVEIANTKPSEQLTRDTIRRRIESIANTGKDLPFCKVCKERH